MLWQFSSPAQTTSTTCTLLIRLVRPQGIPFLYARTDKDEGITHKEIPCDAASNYSAISCHDYQVCTLAFYASVWRNVLRRSKADRKQDLVKKDLATAFDAPEIGSETRRRVRRDTWRTPRRSFEYNRGYHIRVHCTLVVPPRVLTIGEATTCKCRARSPSQEKKR